MPEPLIWSFWGAVSVWLEILTNSGLTTIQPKVQVSEKPASICVHPRPLFPCGPRVPSLVPACPAQVRERELPRRLRPYLRVEEDLAFLIAARRSGA